MKKVKVGIVGTGQRVCFHGGCVFKECKDNVEITALCDSKSERVMHAKKVYEDEFGYEIPVYEDYQQMYSEADLDGVYVCGPNWLHKDMTLKAFEQKIHVLCEKPMEISIANCDEMINVSKDSNCILGLAMQMHYRPRYYKVKEIIDSGAIGLPAMVWCTEYRNPFAEMKDWVWEKDKSGGAIVEKNCHHYDILDLWVQSEPTTVYATGNSLKYAEIYGHPSQIIDNAWIVNDYENGARAMVGICFLAEKNKHYREFGVQGTKGKIFFSSSDHEVIYVEYANGDIEEYKYNLYDGSQNDLRGGVFNDFITCIAEGKEPLVDGATGRQSMLIPLAAEKSIEEKRIVHVSEIQ